MNVNDKESIPELKVRLRILEAERDALIERAERAETFATQLFQSAIIGHAVIDLNGRFQRVNDYVVAMTGYSREELLERGPFEITPEEGHDELRAQLGRLKRGEVPIVILRKKLHRKDGSSFSNEACVQLLGDKEGRVEGMLGSFIDMTEAHELREDLSAKEALFSAVTRQSHEGISVIREDGRRIVVNKALCEMLGYTEEELIGGYAGQFFAKGEPAVSSEVRQRGVEGLEVKFRRKDGSHFTGEIDTRKIRVSGQGLSVTIVRDITQRLKQKKEAAALEAQIQQAQKLESLSVLAGGIAHDFNNLLVSILGNAEIALHSMPQDVFIRETLQDIILSADSAAHLVRQMLAYAGKGAILIEPLSLNSIIAEMENLLEVSVSKNVALRYDLAHGLAAIEADAIQIQQILMNLVINASEAIGKHEGIVTVTTGVMLCDKSHFLKTYLDDQLPPGLYVYLQVSDTGEGMEEESIIRIFEPFYTSKFLGRGLGLAAVLGIVRQHKGAIGVESTPGKGSTFKVLFPALGQMLEERPTGVEQRELSRLKGRVLLVDDEETVRSVCKVMLELMGLEVQTAVDGEDALVCFRDSREPFDLVLMDLTMPRLDGVGCHRELRLLDPKIKVLLSSGYSRQELMSRFVGEGIAGFIQKPYRFHVLHERVRQVLDLSQDEVPEV